MSDWSQDELRRISEEDDLHIAPFRDDGTTYGTPTWIWSVAVDDALYVRAYNGPTRAGTRQPCARKQAASSLPASPKKSPSPPSPTTSSTTASTTPTAPNIAIALISSP